MQIKTYITQTLADTITPISLYSELRDKYTAPILLESSDYNTREGHFSYLCFNPIGTISLKDGVIRTKIEKEISEEKIGYNSQILIKKINAFKAQFEIEKQALTFCTAGLFGYTCFDIVKYSENEALSTNPKEADIPEMIYHFYALILVFNHQNNTLHIVSHAKTNDAAQEQATQILQEIKSVNNRSFPFQLISEEISNISDEAFKSLVTKAKHHCQIGDVFQLVLSKRFKTKFIGDEFNVYRALKNINPSPYLFYFDMGDFRLFGSSPEAQLVVENNKAEIHPIAGTYRRTGNDVHDLEQANELKNDPKENAEHVMLVDLARNDLSKYCKKVTVASYRQTQFYSHVIHLVSKVIGELRTNTNAFELLLGTFPAGTLSGAPKYKALQLINEHENVAREFYGGCVGFIGMENELNHAIMIRTFLSKNNTLHYQAGAGIVVSSNEESELKEIDNKISALRKAIATAECMNAQTKLSTYENQ